MLIYLSILLLLFSSVSAQISRDFPSYCPPISMRNCPLSHYCVDGICEPSPWGCNMWDCLYDSNNKCENDQCVRRPGATCWFDPRCSAGYVCRNGICSNIPELTTTPRPTISPTPDIYCRHDKDCPLGYYCSRWLRRCTRFS